MIASVVLSTWNNCYHSFGDTSQETKSIQNCNKPATTASSEM